MTLRKRLLALCAAAALAATSCGKGGGRSCGCPPAIVLTTQVCSPGGQLGSTCQVLHVSSPPNYARRPVDVRITPAAGGVAPIGTVALLSPGGGTEFTEELPGGPELIADLTAAGFEVVDRRWQDPWLAANTNPRSSAKWSHLLLTHFRHITGSGAPLFVFGQGEGASEAGYSLVRGDGLFAGAVLASGPTLARIDLACATVPPATWQAKCPGFLPPGLCSPPCSLPSSPVCGLAPKTLAQQRDQSILHDDAELDLTGTRVALVFGTLDCQTVAIPQGFQFIDQLESPASHTLVPGEGHDLVGVQAGRDAIVAELLAQALPPPAAASSARLRERITVLEDGEPALVLERASAPGNGPGSSE